MKFYTDLFHVLCGRSTISDVDGKYLDNTWHDGSVKQIPLATAAAGSRCTTTTRCG